MTDNIRSNHVVRQRFALRLLAVAIILISSVLTIEAQSVSLRANSQAIQGQNFTVTIVVTNGDANVTRANAPKLQGCTLLAGPGVTTMQSIQIINGQQSASVSKEYTFTYKAEKAGTVSVPAIKLTVSGKQMQTQPKSITILPPDQAAQSGGGYGYGYGYGYPSAMDEMEELMNELMGGQPSRPGRQQQPAAPQQQSKVTAKDFIVAVTMSKKDIYEKEAVIATIKLYTKHNITKFQPKVMPQFEGFLSEEIDISSQTPQLEHFRGENYYTLVLKKCLLYPQKDGKLTINSGTYDVTLETVDYVSNGYYATPVAKEHNITTTSNSITVNVKPLPAPVPASFNGAVGDFKVSSSLTPEQLRTNEAAKYVLTVSGIGNIKHLAEPNIAFPATVEEYTPTGESDARFNGSNMQGTYTATYTIVPQETGTLDIPSWDFTYFNPATGKYVTTTLPAYSRKVAKGIGAPSTSSAPSTIDTGGLRDIRHILPVDESELSYRNTALFFKSGYWLGYLAALVILVGAVVVYRRHIKSAADVQGRRIRKARSVAAKRLHKARAAMDAHKSDDFYAAIAAALWGFLSDKLKMPASSLTRDNIADTLDKAGATPDMIERTIAVLDDCEMARFTPEHTDSEMSTLYSSASEVIDSLNRIKPHAADKKSEPARSRYAVSILLVMAAGLSAMAAPTTIQQADSAYNAGNFRSALTLYNKALDTQGASSNLYYNIGNTRFRLGHVGHAVVAYERALRLDPSNADARANLDYVNSTLRGLPEDGSSFLSNVHGKVVAQGSVDTWAVVALAIFMVLLGCVALYLFASNTTLRKAGFFGGLVVLVLFIYAVVIAWQTAAAPDSHDTGIVITNNARLTSKPGTTKDRSEKTIAIPEGSKVEILDSLATPNDPVTTLWYNVALNNNTHAWIDASDVSQI